MSIFNKEFWIDQWNTLNKTRSSQSGWANAAVWDSMAENYGSKDETWLDERRKQVQRLIEKGIIFPGAKVLDIGCGPGSHAIPFAEAGCEVVAVDISQKMIERLEREIPAELKDKVKTRVCNWHEMDPDKEGFAEAFDLAFANMTPAIGSFPDLERLMSCSRGWCHFAGWSGERRDSLMEQLRSELNIGHQGAFEGNGLYVYNLLCSMGYTPGSSFTSRGWEKAVPVEKMVEQAAAILSTESGNPVSSVSEDIEKILRNQEEDGKVMRNSTGTSISIQWNIK